jgi:hypothetical protein
MVEAHDQPHALEGPHKANTPEAARRAPRPIAPVHSPAGGHQGMESYGLVPSHHLHLNAGPRGWHEAPALRLRSRSPPKGFLFKFSSL